MLTLKSLSTVLALACIAALGFGFYLQYGLGLEPCPLCILQRLYFALMALTFFLVAFCAKPKLLWLAPLWAILGMLTAGRQVYLQHLPPEQVPACGPGLGYMLDVLPANEVLRELLSGSGQCAHVEWQLLGLSLAEWSLITFAVFTLLIIKGLRLSAHKKRPL